MDILSDKTVITRKKQTCSGCGRMFSPGTKMRTVTTIFDGLQSWRECMTCMILLSSYGSHFEDDGIFYEGCVHGVLNKEQTPEDLLSELSNPSQANPDNKL